MQIKRLGASTVLLLAMFSGQASGAPWPETSGAQAAREVRRDMYSTRHLARILTAQGVGRFSRPAPGAAKARGPGATLQDNPAVEIYRRLQKRRFFNR